MTGNMSGDDRLQERDRYRQHNRYQLVVGEGKEQGLIPLRRITPFVASLLAPAPCGRGVASGRYAPCLVAMRPSLNKHLEVFMRTIERVKHVIKMNTGASSVFRDLVRHLAYPGDNWPISLNRAVTVLDDDNLELYFRCLREIRTSGLGEEFFELANCWNDRTEKTRWL